MEPCGGRFLVEEQARRVKKILVPKSLTKAGCRGGEPSQDPGWILEPLAGIFEQVGDRTSRGGRLENFGSFWPSRTRG